jgi:hypothetical protein
LSWVQFRGQSYFYLYLVQPGCNIKPWRPILHSSYPQYSSCYKISHCSLWPSLLKASNNWSHTRCPCWRPFCVRSWQWWQEQPWQKSQACTSLASFWQCRVPFLQEFWQNSSIFRIFLSKSP